LEEAVMPVDDGGGKQGWAKRCVISLP